MSIQVTPIPRLTVLAVPAFELGVANTAGTAISAVASDATLLAFDTTLPAAVGVSAVGSATVAPRRDHVHSAGTAPVFARVVRASTNLTTTSTSLTDVTGATSTITTGNFPVQFASAGGASHSSLGASKVFNVDVDGDLMLGTGGTNWEQEVANYWENVSFSGQTQVLSAGSHTIKLQFKTSSATLTLESNAGSSHMWSVFEIR